MPVRPGGRCRAMGRPQPTDRTAEPSSWRGRRWERRLLAGSWAQPTHGRFASSGGLRPPGRLEAGAPSTIEVVPHFEIWPNAIVTSSLPPLFLLIHSPATSCARLQPQERRLQFEEVLFRGCVESGRAVYSERPKAGVRPGSSRRCRGPTMSQPISTGSGLRIPGARSRGGP